MRRKAKSIIKLLFIVTCLLIGYYCVVLHQNDPTVNRNRVDVFEKDLAKLEQYVSNDCFFFPECCSKDYKVSSMKLFVSLKR